MSRILITGCQGQVGQELQQTLSACGEVIALGRQGLDLCDADQIDSMIVSLRPDVIVNAAAYTAVDRAETEFDLAKAINGIAPTVMAEATEKIGATLVHLSTDYVFDGHKSSPYTEADPPNPMGAYGQSKLMGEIGIRQACDRHIILRTAWVYGVHGKSNFVKTMLRLGSERDQLRVVADQIGSPTWARDIAEAIAALIGPVGAGAKTNPSPGYGTYHFTNSGVASWYDFAVAIFEQGRQLGTPLKIQQVVPITTSEYPTPAWRPAYSVLACQKISSILGEPPPHWRESLHKMLIELQPSLSASS